MKTLAICIPTANRATTLSKCLKTVQKSIAGFEDRVEVCVSNNGSSDDTQKILDKYQGYDFFKVYTHKRNVGHAKNYLKVVSMASADFIWLIGDDDRLIADSVARALNLIDCNVQSDFFFINSFVVQKSEIKDGLRKWHRSEFTQNDKKISSLTKNRNLCFSELIDPSIAFDFLGGMFCSIFKRQVWLENSNALDAAMITDQPLFSNLDNTFPHLKIWGQGFIKKQAYFNAEPLVVSVVGYREWAKTESLVRAIRIPEALDWYRQNGLSYSRHFACKNYAMRNYAALMADIVTHQSDFEFEIKLKFILTHFLRHSIYPNVWLSPFRYTFKKSAAWVNTKFKSKT